MARETAFVVRWGRGGTHVETIQTREVLKAFAAKLKAKGTAYTVREHAVNEFNHPLKCSWHVETVPFLTYGESERDAKRRVAAGQEQRFCDECGRYFWPDQWGQEPND